MSATFASFGPVGWAAIVVGSWIVLAALSAPRIGRWLDRADDSLCPAWVEWEGDDGDWLDVWPAETTNEQMEQGWFDRQFADMPEVAADLDRSK